MAFFVLARSITREARSIKIIPKQFSRELRLPGGWSVVRQHRMSFVLLLLLMVGVLARPWLSELQYRYSAVGDVLVGEPSWKVGVGWIGVLTSIALEVYLPFIQIPSVFELDDLTGHYRLQTAPSDVLAQLVLLHRSQEISSIPIQPRKVIDRCCEYLETKVWADHELEDEIKWDGPQVSVAGTYSRSRVGLLAP